MSVSFIFKGTALMFLVFLVTWKLFMETTSGLDKPIKLSDPKSAEDFGRYFQTLPADQQKTIGSYLDRVDEGQLLQGELSWHEEEVTPSSLLLSHYKNAD